jgi:hypothetical protein
MFGFMWWLDRNPEEAEMKREERRLLRAKAECEAAALIDHVRRTETSTR